MRKTWHEKYRSRSKPVVEVIEHAFADIPAGSRVIISTPAEVDREVRKIPRGVEMTVSQLREKIAKKHHVPFACPITTGIFLRIASEVAIENIANGKSISGVMPFWGVVRTHSTIGKKLACGQSFIADMRLREGLRI